MSVDKPPRIPRTPPGSSAAATSAASEWSGVSPKPGLSDGSGPNSDNLQAWSLVAQARSKLEDDLVEEAEETARKVLDELVMTGGQEEFALQGSAAAVLGLALAAQDEPTGEDYVQLAVMAFEQAPDWTAKRRDLAGDWGLALGLLGRFDEATAVLDWVLAAPREATALVRWICGEALASTDRTAEAIEVLTKAVEIAPTDWRTCLLLAQLLEETAAPPAQREAAWLQAGQAVLADSQFDLLGEIAERVAEFEPRPENLDLVGKAHMFSGEYDQAVAAFRQSDGLEPSAAVRTHLADALTAAGAVDEAAEAALAALELRPDDRELLAASAFHLLSADRLEGVDLAVEQLALKDAATAAGYRGIVAYRRGNHSLASTELGAAMYEPPDDIDLLWAMAEVLNYLAQPELVLRALDHLLTLDPTRADAQGERGVALVTLGRVEEGEQDLRASLGMTPHPGIRAFLGQYLASAGRFEEALPLLDEAIVAEGYEETWALVAYGQALRGVRRDAEAEQMFRNAVERSPDDLDSLVGLASVLLDQFSADSDTEAAALIEHGLDLVPGWVTLIGLKGELLRRAGQLDEAIDLFEQALREIPEWPWALGSLAQSLRGRFEVSGDTAELDQAQALLDAAVKAAPDEPFLHSELAEVSARQGRPRKAHEQLKAAYKVDPTEVGYLVRRAELYLEAGEPQRARGCLEQALQVRPSYPGLRTQLANLLAEQHELAAAFELLGQAVTDDPDDADAWSARFTLRWNSDRWTEAVEDLDRLQVLWPDSDELMARRGDVLRLQGRYDEALELFDGLLANDPDQELPLMLRGALYLSRGQIPQAREDLEKAAALNPSEPFTQDQLEYLRLTVGEGDQALAELEERLAGEPDPVLQLSYATLLNRCGRPEEAVPILEDGLWGKLEDPIWLTALGWALVGSRRYQEGIGYLSRARDLQPDRIMPLLDLSAAELEIDPDRAEVSARAAIESRRIEPGGWAALSRVQAACGDYDAAAESAATATECWNQLAGAYSALGWALHHSTQDGAAERARDAYQRSHELDAIEPWTVSGLASTLYSLGLRDESRAQYQHCLELLEKRRMPEIHGAALHGWCLFRLGRHEEAWAPALRAVNIAAKPAALLFDLSLIAAGRGRAEEARSLVVRGADEVRREHPKCQRGTLAVARFDLRQLRGDLPPECVELLDQAHAQLLG
ncbi:tetratricopeptide repeat protein [Kribbella sp. NPDC051620]|uniref:tetratricopeptide repeat protein n=1 Tax=Kribbella sp. NPDC051620 TaxID=3364120 RepID=UPI00379A8667